MARQRPVIHARDHEHGGADPVLIAWEDVGADAGGDTLDELILAAAPEGFWKLNETSGTVAADSSGHAQNMSSGSWAVPGWAQPAGPPGQPTADFDDGTPPRAVTRSWAPISGDFTAGIWGKRHSTDYTDMFGQGNPSRAGGRGWQLSVYSSSFSEPQTNRPHALLAGIGYVAALNPLPADTWAFLAVTYSASAAEMKFYVNGLLEGSLTGSYLPVMSWPLWIGHDQDDPSGVGAGYQPCDCVLSYAFLVNHVLTGSELLAMNDAT